MDELNTSKLERLGEKLFVIVIPALGYIIAFAYEYGFASHFGIPTRLIHIGITQILISVSATTVVIVSVFSMCNMIYSFLENDKESPFFIEFVKYIPILIFLFIFIFTLGFSSFYTILILSTFALVIFLNIYLLPKLKIKGEKNFKKRLKKFQEWDIKGGKPSGLTQYINERIIILGAISLMIIMASFLKGSADAKDMQEFLVQKDSQNEVIITQYDSIFFIGVLNENNTIEAIKIRDLESLSGDEFVLKKMDKLKK